MGLRREAIQSSGTAACEKHGGAVQFSSGHHQPRRGQGQRGWACFVSAVLGMDLLALCPQSVIFFGFRGDCLIACFILSIFLTHNSPFTIPHKLRERGGRFCAWWPTFPGARENLVVPDCSPLVWVGWSERERGPAQNMIRAPATGPNLTFG